MKDPGYTGSVRHVGHVAKGLDGKYLASCEKECGWVGQSHSTEAMAWRDHDDHVLAVELRV